MATQPYNPYSPVKIATMVTTRAAYSALAAIKFAQKYKRVNNLTPGIKPIPPISYSSINKATSSRSLYNTVRGVLAQKKDALTDDGSVVVFQFNPAPLEDTKNVEWLTKGYTGMDANDFYWIKGGERTISFTLILDATPGSLTNEITFQSAQDAESQITRNEQLRPYGTLPEVEKLQSFQRPILQNSAVRFVHGAVSPSTRFAPPPILVFSYGETYLECVLGSLRVRHTLMNKDLNPLRTECDISLKIIEGYIPKTISGITKFTNK